MDPFARPSIYARTRTPAQSAADDRRRRLRLAAACASIQQLHPQDRADISLHLRVAFAAAIDRFDAGGIAPFDLADVIEDIAAAVRHCGRKDS